MEGIRVRYYVADDDWIREATLTGLIRLYGLSQVQADAIKVAMDHEETYHFMRESDETIVTVWELPKYKWWNSGSTGGESIRECEYVGYEFHAPIHEPLREVHLSEEPEEIEKIRRIVLMKNTEIALANEKIAKGPKAA